MPHILYMSHISPFPTQGGDRLRAAGLLKVLSQLGTLHAVIGQQPPHCLPSKQDFPDATWHPYDFL